MKKITTKKLSLNRETVRNLNNLDLARVVGGEYPSTNVVCQTINILTTQAESCMLKCHTLGGGSLRACAD